MSVERLSHIGLCVSDLARSEHFYRDLLGFRRLSDLAASGPSVETLLGIPGCRLEAVYLERDAVRLELLHYPQPGFVGPSEPRPMNQLGLTHLSFRVSDLDSLVARLGEAGVAILEHTRVDNPEFGAGAVFVRDPDGTRIELVQAPGSPDALPGA